MVLGFIEAKNGPPYFFFLPISRDNDTISLSQENYSYDKRPSAEQHAVIQSAPLMHHSVTV